MPNLKNEPILVYDVTVSILSIYFSFLGILSFFFSFKERNCQFFILIVNNLVFASTMIFRHHEEESLSYLWLHL